MNVIVGAILIGTAVVLYLKQRPSLRSLTAKTYGVACGFGVFSTAFPMGHWVMVLVGVILQLIAIGGCIVADHDYRASKAMRNHRSKCRELNAEMEQDYEIDKQMCNAFYVKGVQAATVKKMEVTK